MSARLRLRGVLASAWRSTIADAYVKRRINSERGLQVYFCAQLLSQFTDNRMKRALFVEPRVNIPGSKLRLPDIVICNRDRVVAVVELKCRPRGMPSPAKDFTTLVSLSKAGQRVNISNERYHGPAKSRSYEIAADAVLCWAVICKERSVPLPARNAARLGSQLLLLQALTHSNAAPTITVHSAPQLPNIALHTDVRRQRSAPAHGRR